ncbi:uncharacterized protein [Setaria viridis]|uniref:uncharacterized protein n=1 Tax=Setaria viridis TaxID=4556 RepID=UPI003B3B541A
MILVLFETPSGFAISSMLEEDLKGPDALQVLALTFPPWIQTGPREFREFKDKSRAINHDTGISWVTEMIMRWRRPEQKMAVGKPEYKGIIESSLMFTQDEVLTFVRDAEKYEARIHKGICLNVYNEMVKARKYIRMT